jgi:hypothetical protein
MIGITDDGGYRVNGTVVTDPNEAICLALSERGLAALQRRTEGYAIHFALDWNMDGNAGAGYEPTDENIAIVLRNSARVPRPEEYPAIRAEVERYRRGEMPGCESREGFYVSVEHNGRHGLLLGPYSTKAAAEGHVDRGSKLAAQVNDRAHFYGYGVTRLVAKPGRELPQGKLNNVELESS